MRLKQYLSSLLMTAGLVAGALGNDPVHVPWSRLGAPAQAALGERGIHVHTVTLPGGLHLPIDEHGLWVLRLGQAHGWGTPDSGDPPHEDHTGDVAEVAEPSGFGRPFGRSTPRLTVA